MKEFNELAYILKQNIDTIDDIKIDKLKDREFLVVKFTDGKVCVRDTTGNNLVANLLEVAILSHGNYFDELETYINLKEVK